jgi:acyl-coenzyme A synthetase/AMP-(fatty) acid ligase
MMRKLPKKQLKMLKVAGIAIVILVVFLSFFASTVQKNIRVAELSSLVYGDVTSDKLQILSYTAEDQVIQNKTAVSVMFSKTEGAGYKQVCDVFNDDVVAEQLNRQFYFYPLVYGKAAAMKKYQVADDKVTFIFFENGKEKNRIELDRTKKFSGDLVKELNQLPIRKE